MFTQPCLFSRLISFPDATLLLPPGWEGCRNIGSNLSGILTLLYL